MRNISHDFVIDDRTRAVWPGCLPYRGRTSKSGYATFDEALSRVRQVELHYAAKVGAQGGPDLRIYLRTRRGGKITGWKEFSREDAE